MDLGADYCQQVDTFGSALVTQTRCLTVLDARCLTNEGERRSSERQAITPARYDEGAIATDQNAATGERGYHNNIFETKKRGSSEKIPSFCVSSDRAETFGVEVVLGGR